MRKIGRYKIKKQKEIVIIGSLSLLLFLCVGYAAFSTNLSITTKGNIKEQTRVIQCWDNTSQTDFHSDFYKQNIVSVTFLDNNNVPSNATDSWNVSEDKENGEVMAWVVPNNNDNTKYDLYIGAPAGVIANENSSYLFWYFRAVVSIEFNDNFDTRNVTNMQSMFSNCHNIVTLDLSNFDTGNVTNMNAMFGANISISYMKLQNLILSDRFNTSNVMDMSWMFTGCGDLQIVDLSSFDTSNVIYMNNMFGECPSLENIIGLEGFDTSKVTNFYAMFWNCKSMTNLNLCSFSTESATDMGGMFAGTNSLQHVYVGEKFKINDDAITYPLFANSQISQTTTGQC